MSPPFADDRLREAFEAAAAQIPADPTAYQRLSAAWRRRYRRRRLIVALLASLVFAAADAAGLWALNRSDPNTHVIFSDTTPAPGPTGPLDRIGQP